VNDVLIQVGSFSARWTMPRAVDLPLGGELTESGVERSAIAAVSVDVERALPVAVEPAPARKSCVTITESAKLIIDPAIGRYPHDSPFRAELLRSLKFAAEVWGDVAWESIDESHYTMLLRRRCRAAGGEGLQGCPCDRNYDLALGHRRELAARHAEDRARRRAVAAALEG
jgi:hypothetical protein